MTSVQITKNGLYMRINDISKIISGKSAYKKIREIRDNNTDKGNLEINRYWNSKNVHQRKLTKKIMSSSYYIVQEIIKRNMTKNAIFEAQK